MREVWSQVRVVIDWLRLPSPGTSHTPHTGTEASAPLSPPIGPAPPRSSALIGEVPQKLRTSDLHIRAALDKHCATCLRLIVLKDTLDASQVGRLHDHSNQADKIKFINAKDVEKNASGTAK